MFKGLIDVIDRSNINKDTKSYLNDLISSLQEKNDRGKKLMGMTKNFTDANLRIRNRYRYLKIVVPVILVGSAIIITYVFSLSPTTHDEPSRPAVLALTVDPNTSIIYLSNSISNTTSVINGSTNEIEHNILVGRGPNGIAVNPDTNMIYTSDSVSGTVSVIDGSTNKRITNETIGRGQRLAGIAVNPDTNMIYTSNSGPGTVSVIDGSTNGVVQTVLVANGQGLAGIAVNPVTI